MTNPPLYYMSFDELEEDIKYLVLNDDGALVSGSKYGDFFLISKSGSVEYRNPENSKFIPAPQDKPKPNVWDGDLDSLGNFKIGTLVSNVKGALVFNKNLAKSDDVERMIMWLEDLREANK